MTIPMPHTTRKNIYPGLRVAIVLKADQGSGRLTVGTVQDLLTSAPTHPRGIKVRLTDGQVGRVQKIMEPERSCYLLIQNESGDFLCACSGETRSLCLRISHPESVESKVAVERYLAPLGRHTDPAHIFDTSVDADPVFHAFVQKHSFSFPKHAATSFEWLTSDRVELLERQGGLTAKSKEIYEEFRERFEILRSSPE